MRGQAVAMNVRSAYCASYVNPWVRRAAGLDDDGMVELGAAVMHYVSFNRIAHGMMLEPPFVDVRASDFQPDGRRANARDLEIRPRKADRYRVTGLTATIASTTGGQIGRT